jgi:ParB-like nuclease family protein
MMLEFHPLADIFPLVEGRDFAELTADIAEHGLHEPIVLHEEKILDGRNRYRACEAAGVEPRFESYTGDDPVGYVISLNLRRRHLDESQRAMVAAKLATLKRGDNQHSPIGETSQAKAAELLNVGKRSVERAAEVRDRGAPELVSAVEAGRVKVSVAADIAGLSKEEQRAILANVDSREILRAAQQIRAIKSESRRAERDARLIEISKGNTDLPHDRRYPIILADPPWQFSISADDPRIRAPEHHYQTMPLQAICDRSARRSRPPTPSCSCGYQRLCCSCMARLFLTHGASNIAPTSHGQRTTTSARQPAALVSASTAGRSMSTC